MAWSVLLHDEFSEEFDALSPAVQDELLAMMGLLKQFGPSLGRPRVDTLKGSRHANMKELRFDADNGVWRVAFAFDPKREAILLVGGDKSGGGERRFYRQLLKTSGLTAIWRSSNGKGNNMAKTLEDKLARLSPARRGRVEARTVELIAEEQSLRDLRHALALTQEHMAEELGIGQDGISRLEKRSDLLLSTLRSYIEAMGGKLRLVAEFPNRPPVFLGGLQGIAAARSARKSKQETSRRL